MRFVADENLELSIVQALREAGHDVATVPVEIRGSADRQLLALALEEERVLVTNDKDFAELTFLRQRAALGVVLVRLQRLRSREKAIRVLEIVESQGERLTSAMTVIEESVVRRRALPA